MYSLSTFSLPDNLYRYNSRNGYTEQIKIVSEQKITILDFGEKSAIYDFDFEQYFSDIRSSRIIIRGSNGEIINNTCTYLKEGIPHSFEIKRNALVQKKVLTDSRS